MRASKLLVLATFWVLAAGCGMPRYLPTASEIDINPYGARITVDQNRLSSVSGELISVTDDSLLILSEKTKQCEYVARSEITYYGLRYAKSVNYAYVIPLGLLASLTHGYFAVFSAPMNLIVGMAVMISSFNAFTYDHKDISYENLRMFARFPQGIPPGVDCNALKQPVRGGEQEVIR